MPGKRHASQNAKKGPQFVRFFGPVLDALRGLGASARPKEVRDYILDHRLAPVPKEDVERTTKSGQTIFENQVHWARYYLAKAKFVAADQRGVWSLTEAGRKEVLDSAKALALFKHIHASPSNEEATEQPDNRETQSQLPLTSGENLADGQAPVEFINEGQIREDMIKILRGLSSVGFEELCARLLRHSGFENVTITAPTKDKGVDGEGWLMVNRFVRTKVMFQSKRYQGTVGSDKIQAFRGAIQGRAERGIFVTTGTFTRDAETEANRENATPIELVDIERLLDLLIQERLGVHESKALVIEASFFRPFQSAKD